MDILDRVLYCSSSWLTDVLVFVFIVAESSLTPIVWFGWLEVVTRVSTKQNLLARLGLWDIKVPCGRQCVHLCTNIFFSSPLVVFALDVKVDNGKRDNDMYQRWTLLCYLLTWNICVCSMNAINMLHLKWFMFIASHAILVCLCVLNFVLRLNTFLHVQFCVKVHFQLKLSIWFMMLFSKLHIDIFNLLSKSTLEIICWDSFNCIHEPCVKKLFKIERVL